MKHLVLAAALAITSGACVQKELVTTGPTITVTIESASFGGTCRSGSGGSVDPEDMVYTLSFVVDAVAGQAVSADYSTATEYHPVTEITGTLAVPNVTIADSPFDVTSNSAFNDDLTYTRHDPIVIPATAMGQMLSVTLEATDSEGLKGNVIDFGCLLD